MKDNSQYGLYAAFNDLLYKDNKKESNYISRLIKTFLNKEKGKSSIINLAFNTRKYLFELSSKRYASFADIYISLSMFELISKNTENMIKLVYHGFQILHRSPFMHMDKSVIAQEWNIGILTKKVD